MSSKRVPASQTLVRGLDIIGAVAQGGAKDISIIAARTGMTYSTTHRLLSVLLEQNYIRKVTGKGYRLGSKLLSLGYQAYSQVDITRVARPYLELLANKTSDTVHLACDEFGTVLYLDKISGKRPVEISSRIGGSKPLVSTGVGKALILNMTEKQWANLFDLGISTPGTFISPLDRSKWLDNMKKYAIHGYAFDLGENEGSIRCVAAPIYDASHKIIAAVSVSSTTEYMPDERMQNLVGAVKDAAKMVTTDLGGSY